MTRETLLPCQIIAALRSQNDRLRHQAADLIESLLAPPCSVCEGTGREDFRDHSHRCSSCNGSGKAALPRSPVDGRQPSPVVCRHEAYQGRCAHCDVPMIGGKPVPPNSPVDGGVERRLIAFADTDEFDKIFDQYDSGEHSFCGAWKLLVRAALNHWGIEDSDSDGGGQ